MKYVLAPLMLAGLLVSDWFGPTAVWIFFFAFSAFLVFGDYLLGADRSTSQTNLNGVLYIVFPLLLLKIFHLTLLGMGNDKTIIYHILNQESVFDSWKQHYSYFDYIGIILTTGLFLGGIGTVVGHELVHRRKKSFGFNISNWLLALTWDPAFGIEHVHGHHKYVATYEDPESARRGESVYAFVGRSTIGTLKNAWRWEKERLKKGGYSLYSTQNQLFQIYCRSALLTAIISLGGWTSLFLYFLSVVWAKTLLETVNYLEHYGLVRVPGTPIEPKHSWNSNHKVSSYMLYNLTRHSAHHEKGTLPFWELDPYEKAPMLPYGYLTMVYYILIFPKQYRKLMVRHLAHWDSHYASPDELKLIHQYG